MVLASFLTACLLVAAAAASPSTLPLTKRAPIPRNLRAQWVQHEAAHVQNKIKSSLANYDKNKSGKRSTFAPELEARGAADWQPAKRAGQAGVANLTEFWATMLDASYYATVSVGTPSKDFYLVADTGSSDLWIAAPGSTGIPNTFDPDASSTYEDSFLPIEIPYGKGTFDGTLGGDVVSLAGFSSNLSVVESGVVTDDSFEFRQMSGIIGFAWSTIAASATHTFMEQLVLDSALTDNVVAFHLGRGLDTLSVADTSGDGNGTVAAGSITIGGVDPGTYSGTISYFPLVAAAHWVVQSQGVVVGGSVLAGTASVQAMMDTGTSLIVMPNATFNAVASAYGATFDSDNGLLAADCSSDLPAFALRLGGTDYAVAPEDLIFAAIPINSSALAKHYGIAQGGVACLLSFMGGQESSEVGETEPMIIFGDTFLKSWTSVFDVGNSRVGLAAAVPASSYSNVTDAVNLKLKQEAVSRSSGSSSGGGTSAAVRVGSSTFALVAGAAALLLALC